MNEFSAPEQIKTAILCTTDWEHMKGDIGKHLCQNCQKIVFDFAEMTKAESLSLLTAPDQTCRRLTQRPDGANVSGACPAPAKNARRSGFQFSLSGLLILLTCSAALCGAWPTLQKQIGPHINRWVGKVPEENNSATSIPIEIAEPPDEEYGIQ